MPHISIYRQTCAELIECFISEMRGPGAGIARAILDAHREPDAGRAGFVKLYQDMIAHCDEIDKCGLEITPETMRLRTIAKTALSASTQMTEGDN